MKDFKYYAPTEVVFGEHTEEKIGREATDDEIREMVRKCSRNYTATQGSFKVLKPEDMEEIYKMAR